MVAQGGIFDYFLCCSTLKVLVYIRISMVVSTGQSRTELEASVKINQLMASFNLLGVEKTAGTFPARMLLHSHALLSNEAYGNRACAGSCAC
jgi:hypothetical protein